MKVLAIHYSQSGQLTELMNNISVSLSNKQISVEQVIYSPKKAFDFPWSKDRFFDAMPACVLNTGCEIAPYDLKETKYDLIIFGYQPWFLSPSIPTMGLLNDSKFKNILKDTPVVTVIGGRNMWINAQADVKLKIEESGGHIIGNIPFGDKSQNLLSAISIMHWMFTGKKTKKWGIIPLPGISQQDIDESEVFGTLIADYLMGNSKVELQGLFLMTNKIDVKWSIVFIESRAKKLFQFWANLIVNKGTTPQKRKNWLFVYRLYLFIALFIVSPIVLTIYILLRPFLLKREKEEKIEILSV